MPWNTFKRAAYHLKWRIEGRSAFVSRMQDYGVTSSTALLATASLSRSRCQKPASATVLRQKTWSQLTTRIGHLEIPAVSNNQLAAAAFAATF